MLVTNKNLSEMRGFFIYVGLPFNMTGQLFLKQKNLQDVGGFSLLNLINQT